MESAKMEEFNVDASKIMYAIEAKRNAWCHPRHAFTQIGIVRGHGRKGNMKLNFLVYGTLW